MGIMITFTGRKNNIRNADIITRKAHSQYPHISESRINAAISQDKVKDLFWGQMSLEYALKFASERLNIELDEKNAHKHVIESLKKGLGNCYEESKLAELIAKVNGQKNIYSGKIFAGKGLAKHEVAFITDKKIEPDKLYKFKNKEAIILDPWLGITDFAGNYFKKIRTDFSKILGIRPNSKPKIQPDFSSKISARKIAEYKKNNPELIIKKFKKIKV